MPLLFVSVTDVTVQLIFPFRAKLYACLEQRRFSFDITRIRLLGSMPRRKTGWVLFLWSSNLRFCMCNKTHVMQICALPFYKHRGHIAFAYRTAYFLMGSGISFVVIRWAKYEIRSWNKLTLSILIYIQQDATLHSLFYLETALHILGGTIVQVNTIGY